MASSSSGGYVSRYDVFLSFRGETRNKFTDHLYDKLLRAGVFTFRDNDAIPRGEDLKPEIERGIRESRASIIVLSKEYATSRWCLDELCLILEQRKERNHFVLPIFYGVDPSDVRKQDGPFKIEVIANTKWTEENVGRWKAALEKVGNMTGEVANGPETGFLEKIADIIKEKLNLKQVYRQANLIGMETRDKEINYWLEESDNEILAIWGMEGGGKTTLARHIAYSNWHKFDNVSILENIGSRSNEGLRHLQEKLISDIMEGKEKTNPSSWQNTYTIENALKRKKILIVLDNIVTKKQLDALIGTGTITQSKIIITTTERGSSKWFKSPWRCQEYEMKLLDEGDSLKLLRLHAFEPNDPMEGYEELEKRALRYCEGNPLALEVWGSSLNCKSSDSSNSRKEFWESMMTSLERQVPGQIQSVLITSYNELQLNSVKELFLHIACFFNGQDKDYVEKILEPDYNAISGIVTLINSCLLSVSPNNKLMMHRLLQEMGRTIVLAESPKRPGKRSRVWRNNESLDVLIKKNGSAQVEGLALDMKILSQEHVEGEQELSELDTDSFMKMNNLKLLQINQLELKGSYMHISKDLRWLCWRKCRLTTIPSELDIRKLVAIDMSYSKLEVFEPPKVLPSLKILDLQGSENLVAIKNISRLPKLETLNLQNCCRLVHVGDTLGELTSLTLLNLTGCENISERGEYSLLDENSITQPQFHLPNSLKGLFLMDCNHKDTNYFPLSFNDQTQLEYLNLAVNPFELLPNYTHLDNLQVLDLSCCRALKRLLSLPRKLAELYIFYCDSLESVTFELHKFTLQEFRYEGCVNLSEVEDFFKIVPVAMLTEDDLGHMNWLRAYQDLEVCLVGDDDLTKGRTLHLQMLYEFSIMSISLPDIDKPNMIPENEYTSEDPLLSFEIPESHRNRKLKGLNLTFKYTLQGDEWVWFAIIRTNNGVNLIYNAKVFGKPAADEVGIWLSYWPIGKSLGVGDEVNVSIIVTNGLEINGCGASLVYAGEEDEDESVEDSNKSFVENHESFEDANDFYKDNNEHADILGEDISGFKLSKGTYYLCRRDYSQLMEVGRLTPNWFRDLVGDTIDYTEIGGWRKTGRPDQPYRSYRKLKTDGCIIYGPHLEELYKIEELSESSLSDKTEECTSEFSEDATKIVPVTTISDEEKLSSLARERIFHRFSLAEIKLATLNFDDELVIGKGGFGKVYKGRIYGAKDTTAARLVAIKRLDSFSRQGASEFMTKIEMLSKLRHCHLVSLIGYCSDSNEMILVYEYIPNGSIEHHLHKDDSPLSWIHRLNISIGAARGLDYLHTGVGTQHGIIHRDVKSSNILLDENFSAKIADFGLSKIINEPSSAVSTTIIGTFGYLDPEYYTTGHLTMKSDVYAFGVVLFELLSGRRAVDTWFSEEQWNLANWARKCVKERRLDQLVSSHIREQISPKCLKEFAQIADRCLKSSRKKRPTMAEVVVALQLSLTLQEQFDRSVLLATGSLRSTYKLPKYLVFGAKNNSVGLDTESPTDNGLMEYSFRIFSYSDLELATRNFGSHMLLGHGQYGEAFRGWLNRKTYTPSFSDSGLTIAVKRLYQSKFKPHKLNMKILEEFNDPNIVKILGYCAEEDTVLIVYEFMHQGTLNDYLFSELNKMTERHQLISRVKIAIGVVRGLVFLRTQPQLADCPLQTHNILLDEELNAKLSDFDVAMLVLSSDATLHFDPDDLKVKSGVFGFGVILMELLTGKPINNEDELLVTKDYLPGEHGSIMKSIGSSLDIKLRFNFLLARPAVKLALLAHKCVIDESSLRPTLESVLEELEEIYDVMLKLDNSGN